MTKESEVTEVSEVNEVWACDLLSVRGLGQYLSIVIVKIVFICELFKSKVEDRLLHCTKSWNCMPSN